MPSVTARGHVAEIEQALERVGNSAYAEFGHPLSFARELAAADRATRAWQWWAVTTSSTVVPLLLAGLMLTNQSWGYSPYRSRQVLYCPPPSPSAPAGATGRGR